MKGVTGYDLGAIIGRGGMGEVVQARDHDFGRDVALKRMRAGEADPEAVARFLREAKIQARLDHPAIVPVHELGRDADGRPYFTMKRLAGTTLEAVLAAGDATLQRLLRALVEVCHAIDLAHSRGVVHRDLKPANIMLGDYGEVYVLDWGVARVLGQPESPNATTAASPSVEIQTEAGGILGTPGYMPPEQALGAEVGPPADVYAIGAILFEILAGEPLHPRGPGALASTIGTVVSSPMLRCPERPTPPELDAICDAALASDPTVRPTARELGDQIQHYLDGDRDVERRRAVAARYLDAARAAIDAGDRAEAIRATGRAVVFDPDSDAAAILSDLIFDVPDVLPPELVQVTQAGEDRINSERSRRAFWTLIAFIATFPVMFVLKVGSWPQLLGVYTAAAVMAAIAWINWRRARVPDGVMVVMTLVLVVMFSRLLSPFVVTPVLICALLLAITATPWVTQRSWVIYGWIGLAVALPFGLEWLGVFASTWHVTDAGLVTAGTVFVEHSEVATVGAHMAMIVAITLHLRGFARDRLQAQRQLQIQAWHLRQLLPHRGLPRAAKLP